MDWTSRALTNENNGICRFGSGSLAILERLGQTVTSEYCLHPMTLNLIFYVLYKDFLQDISFLSWFSLVVLHKTVCRCCRIALLTSHMSYQFLAFAVPTVIVFVVHVCFVYIIDYLLELI